MKCLHCKIRLGYRARGLCGHCYPMVKDQYPKLKARTVSDSIMEAVEYLQAHGIGGNQESGIGLSFIVRESWKRAPAVFGLPDFQDAYPDSNRVIVEVVRMVKTGRLKRVAERRYVRS